MHVPWLIGVWRDSFKTYSNVLTHVPRLIRVWHDWSRLIQTYSDVFRRIQTYSCMCFSSFVCVYEAIASRDVPQRRCVRNALIHTQDITDSDVFMHVLWLLRAWHNSFRRIYAFVCVWMKQLPRVTRLREGTREIHLFLGETCLIQTSLCICPAWLIRVCDDLFICDVTHSCVTWLLHMWHDSFMWDMTRLCVCLDSFVCDMTHSYATLLVHTWHDSCICDMTPSCETWLVCACALAHSCVRIWGGFD